MNVLSAKNDEHTYVVCIGNIKAWEPEVIRRCNSSLKKLKLPFETNRDLSEEKKWLQGQLISRNKI